MKFKNGKKIIVLLLCLTMLSTSEGMTSWAKESVDTAQTQQTIVPPETSEETENQGTENEQTPPTLVPPTQEKTVIEEPALTIQEETKSELMKFLVVEKGKIIAPEQQNIIVGLNEHEDVIQSAKLTYREKTSGKESVVDVKEITADALVFQFGFLVGEEGVYQIAKITYTTEQGSYYFDLSLVGNEPQFGVNQDIEMEANGVLIDQEQLAQQIQNQATLDTVITDTDGKELTKIEIEQAVEAAEETSVTTSSDAISGMSVDEEEVKDISSMVLSNEAKVKMGAALKQMTLNTTMQAIPIASVPKTVTIVLDPGHGGTDPGVARTYDGAVRTERDNVLKIAQYCKAELGKYLNVKVYMTRTDNTSALWNRKERADYALSVGADILVSIHINSTGNTGTNGTASGSLVYVPNTNWKPDIALTGTQVGNEILKCLNQLGLTNRGTVIQNANDGTLYEDGSVADYLGINYYSKLNGFPGIIVEHAFMNNESDYRTYLNTDEKLKNLGVADAVGLAKYFGLIKGTPNTPVITKANRNSDGNVVVNWIGQDDASNFDIYRFDSITGNMKYVGEVAGTQTSFTDLNANQNQTYYYSVQALSPYGSSLWAKKVQTGVEITSTQSITSGQILINFQKATAGTGYYVFRRMEGQERYTQIATLTGVNTSTYVDTNVAPGVRYEYTIACYTTDLGTQFNSSIGQIKTGMSVSAPVINSANREDGKVVVRYDKINEAISYEIYRSETIDGRYNYLKAAVEQYCIDESAVAGKTYYYKVLGINREYIDYGISSFSKAVQTGVEITSTQSITSSQILINFQKATVGTGYFVFRRMEGQERYTQIATLTGVNTSAYLDTNVAPGVRYEYAIACYTINGGMIYNSGVGKVKTGMSVSMPVINSANRETGKVVIRYDKINEAISYEIYRSETIDGRYNYLKSTVEQYCVDESAVVGKTYYYKVLGINREYNDYGISSFSKAVQTGVEITGCNSLKIDTITVNWEASSKGTGYYLFRKLASESRYSLISIIGSISVTQYNDTAIKKGDLYDYVVAPYTINSGVEYVGAVGQPYQCEVFSAPTINSANFNGSGVLVSYSGNSSATSYEIYRSTAVDGFYGYLGCTTDLKYLDSTATSTQTYYYKVLAVKQKNGVLQMSFSKPVISGTDVVSVVSVAPNSLYVSWNKSINADGYYLFRKGYGGSYQLLATINNGEVFYYDRTATSQTVYTYCVAAYKNSTYGLINSAVAGEKSGGLCLSTTVTQVKLVADAKMNLMMQVEWTPISGASRYIVCRSDNPDWSFSQVGVVNEGSTCSFKDSLIVLGQTYYYKIIVEQDAVGTTLKSPVSNGKGYSITGNLIMGESTVTVAQIAAHYKARTTAPYPADIYGAADKGGVDTIEKFAAIVLEEANIEGVRAEIVWAQLCNETGFLRFDGDVKAGQCNFAGMGATGGGVPGLTFATVRLGIRAQVQHLKAYASKAALNQTCVDPRFNYVYRESAPYVEWLGIQENPIGKGWAAAKNYGYYLMALVGQVKSY